MNVFEAALSAEVAGLSVLPPMQDGSKAPDGKWAQYQCERASRDQIVRWYEPGRTGVGWVTGEISGNLEVLDFDDRSIWAQYRTACKDAGLLPLLERVEAGYSEQTPNGFHLPYQCDEISGSLKLAKREDKKAIIETKGEGGFIICAPSHGSVNASGPYELQSGSIETIVTITPEERRALHDVARIFDETIRPVESQRHEPAGDGRPGDDYNARASWAEVLEPHGWVRVFGRLGVDSWRRPGKDRGISATTNHADSDLFYCFSTSTGFEPNRGYSKFSVFTQLDHGGDFSAAGRALALLGYGQPEVEIPSDVDLSGIMAMGTNKFPPDLLRVPGLVGELAEWINVSSIKPQPVLALGASISAVATIIGRKVQTETRLRPNVYIIGVGHTGCGKERARQCIKAIFSKLDRARMIGEQFASDAAIEAAVDLSPACLYLIDEIGHYLGTIKDAVTTPHLRNIVPVLMRMFTSSDSNYIRRVYANTGTKENEKKDPIEQPCLSIYGTTVPGNLFTSIAKTQLADGFLGRVIVFESEDHNPRESDPASGSWDVPDRILEGFRTWAEFEAGQLNPDPITVPATASARALFDALKDESWGRIQKVIDSGGEPGPYTRVVAIARKLALIRACGVRLTSSEVTEADAEWGVRLARWLVDRFVDRIGENVAENLTEANANRVRGIIASAGSEGLAKSKMTKNTTWLKPGERRDTLNNLIESGDVLEIKIETGGRPRTVYKTRV